MLLNAIQVSSEDDNRSARFTNAKVELKTFGRPASVTTLFSSKLISAVGLLENRLRVDTWLEHASVESDGSLIDLFRANQYE